MAVRNGPKSSDCYYCIKENTGIYNTKWKWWVAKASVPQLNEEENQKYTVMWDWIKPGPISEISRWHEEKEFELLKQLFKVTVEVAERRAKEYWCNGGTKKAASVDEMLNYVKWKEAVETYRSELVVNHVGSHFDDKYGIMMKDHSCPKQLFENSNR
jgi:hypothetical protein